MKAFTDSVVTKEEMIDELKWHQKQDSFTKGKYHYENYEKFKGCAVGCSINSINRKKGLNLKYGDHSAYETHLGVPEWLARLEDRLFEGMSVDRSKIWPVDFMEAISVGSDLNKIKKPFFTMVLRKSLESFDHVKFPNVKTAIEAVILHQETVYESAEAEEESRILVRDRVFDARRSAYAAAYDAAYAADVAAYAADAAYAAAVAAYVAAYAAADAAYVAAVAAYAAYDAAAGGYAERMKVFEYFADELLKLMKGCL